MNEITMCGCIGPQNGDPVCPCRMKNVRVENGRYIEIHDLGPAEPEAQEAVKRAIRMLDWRKRGIRFGDDIAFGEAMVEKPRTTLTGGREVYPQGLYREPPGVSGGRGT